MIAALTSGGLDHGHFEPERRNLPMNLDASAFPGNFPSPQDALGTTIIFQAAASSK
jgi:hypothetical protein